MPKEISADQKEHINLLLEEQTYSPEWQDGFLSTFKKNNYDTREIVRRFVKNKPADPVGVVDIDVHMALLKEEVDAVKGELKKINSLLEKEKITAVDFSKEIAPWFASFASSEPHYNILNLHKTNELRFKIINLIKKDEKFKAENDLEKFDRPLLNKLKGEIKSLQDTIDDFDKPIESDNRAGNAKAQNNDANGQQNPKIEEVEKINLEKMQSARNKIVELLPPIQKKIRKVITETLSEQWGNDTDDSETKAQKVSRTRRVRIYKKANITTKVKTTHLLCKAQNVINNIYNEYYGLVYSLRKKSDIPPSNFHTFGTMIFDLFLQNTEGISIFDKDATLSARYDQAKEFKDSIIESAKKLEELNKSIVKKELSTNTSNAEIKGENIRPVAVGLQYFLDTLWLQVQSIDDYLGVDFTPKKESDFTRHFKKGKGPLWKMYKKKLQTIANSISTDVSSTINQLKPHWQRSAIAEVNIQARNFTDVVGSYMHILLRTPRLIIETKKAKFELVRIVNRIELGLEHEMDISIEKTEAVFSLIKGIANTAGEAANLAAAASGVMVTGGMSHGSASGFTKTETSASGDISTTQTETYPGSTQSYVPLGRIDMKTDGILQGVENLCTLGARQALKEIQIIIKQTHSSLENDLAILEEMQQCAQNAQKAILGKEERWLPQIDIVRFETEGDRYLDFLAGLWAASGIINHENGSSTPGKLERENLRAKTNEYNAITKLAEQNKLQLTVSQ